MEQLINPPVEVHHPVELESTSKPFIEANTLASSLEEIRNKHIIPVFVKDNEPLISHDEFIEAAATITTDVFHGEQILKPVVRVSHPIKGRVPEAKDKPANQLYEWEKTLYYERMMFVIEVPSVQANIGGNMLSLTIGGVKAYNQDNLYSRIQSEQHFKIFIGFQNRVCTNLCVWSDGLLSDVKVHGLSELHVHMKLLFESFSPGYQLHHLDALTNYSITEQQFAHLIGKCRMYQYIPNEQKKNIPPLLFGDQQLGTVVKDYYKDSSFYRNENGNINLWKLYNLFTEANKSSYIDNFLDRSANAFKLVEQVRYGLEGNDEGCWYFELNIGINP